STTCPSRRVSASSTGRWAPVPPIIPASRTSASEGSRRSRGLQPFPGLQCQLALRVPAIAAQGATLLDDAVAGDQHGNGVGPYCSARGAGGGGLTAGSGQLAIGDGAPRRNTQQRAPHGKLEVGALDMQWWSDIGALPEQLFRQ